VSAVFLDTVGLIAIWDEDDQWHAPAEAVYRRIVERGRPLVCTESVLLECGNSAARRIYRCRVGALRKQLFEEGALYEPTGAEMNIAWEAYDRGEANAAGIVDHISFVIMRRLGITDAFTNDRHFRAAGFVPLF
jgi:predicted nucleic acid-binding protein